MPTLFAAMRGSEVGTDTPTYYYLYLLVNQLTFSQFLEGTRISVEPLYYFCSRLGEYLTGFSTLLFIYQGLSILFLYNVAYRFRKYLNIALVFYLYFTFIFPYSLNIMRQILAVMYILWLSTYLLENKPTKFIIGSLAGIIIHSSIIVGMIIYFWIYLIYRASENKRIIYIALSLIGMAGAIFILKRLEVIFGSLGIGELARYSNYLENGDSYLGKTDLVIRFIFTACLVLGLKFKFITKRVFWPLFILLLIEMLLIFYGTMATVIFRLALYCTAADIIIIPVLGKSTILNKESRILTQWLIVFFATVYWWYTMVVHNTNETIPYYCM